MDENFKWVFPPSGAGPDSFGPVHLYDTIELSWTPSSLYIAPPYKLQMACGLANQTIIFIPLTNVSSPTLWFFKHSYDTQPYSCWYGFMAPPGGQGGTGGAFHVVPTSAATASTFRATATSSSTAISTSSILSTTKAAAQTTATSAAATEAANDGLSGGAKAGIGVGVALGAILLIALLLGALFFHRKKKRRQTAHEILGQEIEGKNGYDKPPLAYAEAEAAYPYVEAEAREPRLELPA